MKRIRIMFLVLATAVAASACAVTGAYYYRSDRFQPDYVYLYPDGCWADDLWYSPCPWVPGPHWGYYRFYGGYYYWQRDFYWQYRPHHPPPGLWRHRWHRHGRDHRFPVRPPRHRPPHRRR